MVRFGLISLFFAAFCALSANAALDEWTRTLLLEPLCNSCQEYTKEAIEISEEDLQIDYINRVCSTYPASLTSAYPGESWDSHCRNTTLYNGDLTEIQVCATLGVCPTECAYCDSRAYQVNKNIVRSIFGPDASEMAHSFCDSSKNFFGTDYGRCLQRASLTSADETETTDFCDPELSTENPYPCSNTGAVALPWLHLQNTILEELRVLSDEPGVCGGHGALAFNFAENCNSYDDGTHICFEDLSSYEEECECNTASGYHLSGGTCVLDPNFTAVQSGRGASFVSRMRTGHQHKVRSTQQVSVTSQIKLALRLLRAGVTPIFDCTGQEWTYFADSPVDGVTGHLIGSNSLHETYGFAVKQSSTKVTIAINSNLGIEGETINAQVRVAMGDWIMNPMNPDGTFSPMDVANSDLRLWGIKFDRKNDNGDEPGIYKEAKFIAVGGSNAGFPGTAAYMSSIDNMNSVSNPTASVLSFGSYIDTCGERGLAYLTPSAFNLMEPGYATFVGGLNPDMHPDYPGDGIGEVFYWNNEAPDNQYVSDLGLNWIPQGALGSFTRVISFSRQLLPIEEVWFSMHAASECFNDVFGAKVKFCEVPSESRSPSRTPTRTPSRTPTVSPSRTPTTSPSLTRTPSVTTTVSPAPSMPPIVDGECSCLDYGDEEAFGITTLSLGQFDGTSDTQGRLYVCGDANLKSYSVSDGLPPSTTRTDLYVDGTLNFPTGRILGGNVVYGEDAVLGNSVAQGMYNRTVTQQPGYFPCQHAESYYKAFALNVGTKAASGRTTLKDDGTIEFTRLGAGTIEMFDFNCSDLPKVNKMTFHGTPAGQTVVVNWRGESCDIKELNIVPLNPAVVLFNFPDATEILIKAAAVEASILAPFAHITGSGGYVRGKVVAGSWSGSTQQNYMDCLACMNSLDPWLGPTFLQRESRVGNLTPQ